MNKDLQKIPAFIRRHCPGASEQELIEATDRFHAYIALAYRIYERIEREQAERDSAESSSSDRFGGITS